MLQHELEQRYRRICNFIENTHRMHADRREDMSGPQVGVIVNSDVTLWEALPEDPDDDEAFAKKLCDKARARAKLQE